MSQQKQPLAFIIRFDRFPNKYEKKSSEERTESSNWTELALYCCGVRHIYSSDSSCDVSWLLHFLIFQLTCGVWGAMCVVWSSPKRVPHQKSYFRTVCRAFLPYLTGMNISEINGFFFKCKQHFFLLLCNLDGYQFRLQTYNIIKCHIFPN